MNFNSPPPFRCTKYGNLQMFPRPTAKPMDARMNSDLCPQLSRVDFTAAPSLAFSITAKTRCRGKQSLQG